VAGFAQEARALGVDYLGLCCGSAPHYIRSIAEAIGRMPPASRYSPDLSEHFALGDEASGRQQGTGGTASQL
jgi:betaine-homocysteine S-methyltransferase